MGVVSSLTFTCYICWKLAFVGDPHEWRPGMDHGSRGRKRPHGFSLSFRHTTPQHRRTVAVRGALVRLEDLRVGATSYAPSPSPPLQQSGGHPSATRNKAAHSTRHFLQTHSSDNTLHSVNIELILVVSEVEICRKMALLRDPP